MHPALIDLLGAVADEARWDASLHGYAASLGADQVGWFVLASGPELRGEQHVKQRAIW